MEPTRPPLDPQLTGAELTRWYWERSELAGLARRLGVSAAGGKQQLTERLVAVLDGGTGPEVVRRPATPQLRGPLTPETVIPVGQRCSQVLRAFFVEQIGPQFRFDRHLREFIGAEPGHTLGEAVEHYGATRDAGPSDIAPQFELNRFTRRWYAEHPGGGRDELLAAWRDYRATPTDARPPA